MNVAINLRVPKTMELFSWVYSAQDRDYLRALVNVALNLRVPQTMELGLFGLG